VREKGSFSMSENICHGNVRVNKMEKKTFYKILTKLRITGAMVAARHAIVV
jgi:hypothetical protein